MMDEKEFEEQFSQWMNPPQEPDRKKSQPLAMEVIADEVRSRCLVREIVNMVCDPGNDLDKLQSMRDAIQTIWRN